jgi:DNA invertase Pin-like site-specific DNA recombinase
MTKRVEPTKTLRCAIYTRKSSEEGLDQAFNSLHAQREACEAYIKSQAQEGWTALPAVYDDGGFSGGTLDRPAIQRLLADIDAGRVDTVVVYKIDRLTRSLADFAKIVERMDAAGASFVSVTQAFNTTTSMGRLTLNVLLSFAQFEREVTGERIRDKIAASKAKGMWMGGTLPLGYDRPTDLATRALVVNDVEAEQVRLIFRRYVELRSVSALQHWLDENAIRSKACVTKAGRAIGGLPFSRGALFHLLANRTYIGEIPHKETSYPGAHPAIVDRALFDAAQALMTANTTTHRKRPTRVSAMPLKGLIFDGDGQPMSPTFGHGNRGQVYRYYVSAPLQQGRGWQLDDDAIRRVPAEAVEELVLDRLQTLRRNRAGTPMSWVAATALLRRIEIHSSAVHLQINGQALFGAHADLAIEAGKLGDRLPSDERVVVDQNDPAMVRLILPVRLKLRGGRSWIVTPDGSPLLAKAKIDRVLVKGLQSSQRLVEEMTRTTAADGSRREIRTPASTYNRMLCNVAFLAPDIQRAILEGRQPPGFNLQQLLYGTIPLAWVDQRAAFGF